MLTSDLAFRGAVLALSALAHLLFYGALSLAPAWPPPPRTGLIVTELIAAEPPAPPVVQPVTPPRPRVKPKPQARPVETIAPQTTPRVESRVGPPIEPQIEREIASPPIEAAAAVVSSETTRDVREAPASTIASTPTGSAPAPVVSSTEASGPATLTSSRSGSAAVVAALSPAAAVSAAVTRTAIPRGGYQVTPSYPATARRLGIEGTALLRVFVDAKGHVGDVVVKQSAGHPDLDRAAADAVRRWRFDPARQGTDAVAMWVELPVEFHLR
jgi:periplasmic protein TonB